MALSTAARLASGRQQRLHQEGALVERRQEVGAEPEREHDRGRRDRDREQLDHARPAQRRIEQRTVGALESDHQAGLVERARPAGRIRSASDGTSVIASSSEIAIAEATATASGA